MASVSNDDRPPVARPDPKPSSPTPRSGAHTLAGAPAGTCPSSPERDTVRFTITPLGGAGRAVGRIVDAIVRYLQPRTCEPTAPGPSHPARGDVGPARYYADSGEDPGRWRGRGAQALGLTGDVTEADLAKVLAARDPVTGARLLGAQGSAGRRPKLGVGTETRRGADGLVLYDARDAAAVLGLPVKQVHTMLDVGIAVALARLFSQPAEPAQPEGSYLVPTIDTTGNKWVPESELSRCEAGLLTGTAPEQVAALGPPDEVLSIGEAARLAGVTSRYLRRVGQRHETRHPALEAALARGRRPRQAHLVAQRGQGRRWLVRRDELAAFLARRRPPAVRVGYDLTLTTEKSLGVLALLADDTTRREVLAAIRAGNEWALDWLERHAAVTRANGQPVPARGWTVASFRHLTSRALDPFPHHHNVIANTVEDHHGTRRTLDARALYEHAHAASALATAEMRYQLTHRLGVRWRPGRNGSWEVAGIPDSILREFSRRRSDIDDALRELEDAIGRDPTLGELDRIVLKTRPAKQHVPVTELLDGWRRRAAALGFGLSDIATCLSRGAQDTEPDPEALFAALAASDGICANLSVFSRADVLAALVDLAVPRADNDPQPLVVPAARLDALTDRFLASNHALKLTPGRYTTREILSVQQRIVARYRHGLHRGTALVPSEVIDRVLAHQPKLTAQQRRLVRDFCTSGHRIQCAIGRAGAGKTTTMATARNAWEAAGWQVVGAAVKGEAARTLGAATGMPTETLAWYLAHHDPVRAPLDARTVLVVDEASTISDRDLDRLGWLAVQAGATLRLIGDPAQHGAVEAGGMFRVLCDHHPAQTPQLTVTHRVTDPLDRAAADALRSGHIATALDVLDAAGHLHLVEDELDYLRQALSRWWAAHQAGLHHPVVDRRNAVRRQFNRLAHRLLQATGEIGRDEITASGDRGFSVGDRVIARSPDRDLHPPGRPDAYVRNGAQGTIAALHPASTPDRDRITVTFDSIGTIDLPRRYFDLHTTRGRHPDAGLDHAYAVTSYAVQGTTRAISTSRIDPSSTRAEAYVDITRGMNDNHLYLTRTRDPLDGEALPALPPPPVDDVVARRLTHSTGEITAWELHLVAQEQGLQRHIDAVGR
jgi:conjugative relaxase-like TrwC/TraI family protein